LDGFHESIIKFFHFFFIFLSTTAQHVPLYTV